MSGRDLIDPESRVPLDLLLEVLLGGFNAIADIVARRAAVTQVLAPATSSTASGGGSTGAAARSTPRTTSTRTCSRDSPAATSTPGCAPP